MPLQPGGVSFLIEWGSGGFRIGVHNHGDLLSYLVRVRVEFDAISSFQIDLGDLLPDETKYVQIEEVARKNGIDAHSLIRHIEAVAGGRTEPNPQDRFLILSKNDEGVEHATAVLLAYDRKAKGLRLVNAPVSARFLTPSSVVIALPEHRPKVRLTFPPTPAANPIKTQIDSMNFISGLALPFVAVRNNGPEEAFRVQLTLPELRGLKATLKQVDNLPPGDAVTFHHRELKYWLRGEQQKTQNFWIMMASLNMMLPADHPERISYPLSLSVTYEDPNGMRFITRYELAANEHGTNLNFVADERA
jgi:hypothetical protein